MLDHIRTADIDVDPQAIRTMPEGDAIVPPGHDDTLLCYVMNDDFMRQLAARNHLQLDVSEMNRGNVKKQYVYLKTVS